VRKRAPASLFPTIFARSSLTEKKPGCFTVSLRLATFRFPSMMGSLRATTT
jgi:hypothetical protein